MGFTILKAGRVVTRKPHKCFGCCEVFPKGTKMEYQFSVHSNGYDGGSMYLCIPCFDYLRAHPDMQYDMAEFGVGAGFVVLEREEDDCHRIGDADAR